MKWDVLTECSECSWMRREEHRKPYAPGKPVSVGDRNYQCPGCEDGVRFILSVAVSSSPVGCLDVRDEQHGSKSKN